MPSTPYVRGTKTVRITTARLCPGNALVTRPATSSGTTSPATTLTGAIVRTVATLHTVLIRGRQSRRVIFEDGAVAQLPGHQTWAVVADTVQARP
jgi:hypothetical protein